VYGLALPTIKWAITRDPEELVPLLGGDVEFVEPDELGRGTEDIDVAEPVLAALDIGAPDGTETELDPDTDDAIDPPALSTLEIEVTPEDTETTEAERDGGEAMLDIEFAADEIPVPLSDPSRAWSGAAFVKVERDRERKRRRVDILG
jgi:hypothetical protein